MFIELDLDGGIVILNINHIIAIEISDGYETTIHGDPLCTSVIISTSESVYNTYYRKTFSYNNGLSKQQAFEYFEKLSKMLDAKKEEKY